MTDHIDTSPTPEGATPPGKPKRAPKRVLEPYAAEILHMASEGRSMQYIVRWLAEPPRNVTITRQAVNLWWNARKPNQAKLDVAFATNVALHESATNHRPEPSGEFRSGGLQGADYGHALAECFAQADALMKVVAQAQNDTEELLDKSAELTRWVTLQLRGARTQMDSQFRRLEAALLASFQQEGDTQVRAVTDALVSGWKVISQVSHIADLRTQSLAAQADKLNEAAERLEKAAEAAVGERRTAEERLAVSQIYEAKLQEYANDLKKRIRKAKAQLYEFQGLWRRILFVFNPQTPDLGDIMPPSPPLPAGQPKKLSPPPLSDQGWHPGAEKS